MSFDYFRVENETHHRYIIGRIEESTLHANQICKVCMIDGIISLLDPTFSMICECSHFDPIFHLHPTLKNVTNFVMSGVHVFHYKLASQFSTNMTLISGVTGGFAGGTVPPLAAFTGLGEGKKAKNIGKRRGKRSALHLLKVTVKYFGSTFWVKSLEKIIPLPPPLQPIQDNCYNCLLSALSET